MKYLTCRVSVKYKSYNSYTIINKYLTIRYKKQ